VERGTPSPSSSPVEGEEEKRMNTPLPSRERREKEE